MQSRNLLHNSKKDWSTLNHLSFLIGKSSVEECNNKDLKQMLYVRGAGVTGKGGSAFNVAKLKQHVTAFIRLEK